MSIQFDVAIVGGGLVGLATACALSHYDLKRLGSELQR